MPQSAVQYIGIKRKLLDWIREQIPEGVKTVVDAFAGGVSLGYMLMLVVLGTGQSPVFFYTC